MDEKQFEERKAAFETFTKDSIEAYCKKYGIRIPRSNAEFWLRAHSSRIFMEDIDLEYVYKSVLWLFENHYNRIPTEGVIETLKKAGYSIPGIE